MSINLVGLKFQSLIESFSVKSVCSIVVVAISQAIGQNTLAYEVLFILVILDTITGTMIGIKYKKLSSEGFKRTAYKLILYFTLIIATHQLTRLQDALIWAEEFVVIYLAITEVLSIIENAHRLGVPLPDWLSERLSGYLSQNYSKTKSEGRKKGTSSDKTL